MDSAKIKRWANTGPNGEMEEHPQGEFVLAVDVLPSKKCSCPEPRVCACGTVCERCFGAVNMQFRRGEQADGQP